MANKNNLKKTKNKKINAAVMLSGGLDSRLVLKIMQEQLGTKNVVCLFFKLPFGAGCCHEESCFDFAKTQNSKLEIFDCTKGKLLKEYLSIIKNPKFGIGKGINPCVDCRLFMLKKAKKYIEKNNIDIVVTGEVLGERPMSQKSKSLKIIEKESGLKGKLLRPLSAKLLEETDVEKEGFVDRTKFLDIEGRQRQRQIELAKKYEISYPTPAGGCLLCEKFLRKRFKKLIKNDLINETNLPLASLGRHFFFHKEDKNYWFIVGRDEVENEIIEKFENSLPSEKGTPAVYHHDKDKDSRKRAKELQEGYRSRLKNSKKIREKLEKNKI